MKLNILNTQNATCYLGMSVFLPHIGISQTRPVQVGQPEIRTIFSFPTKLCSVNGPRSLDIVIRILGFGVGFTIKEKG